MSRSWLTALLLGTLCACGAGSVPVTAAMVIDQGHTPMNEIFTFDRVDIFWTLDETDADSVKVDFGDGSDSVLPGDATQVRNIYDGEGLFQITVTTWRDGHSFPATDPDPIRVQRRRVPGWNVLFLHHSTGRYMIRDCGFRSLVDSHNNTAGTDIQFWDHDYASGNFYTGLILPDSTVHSDWIYGPEANDITPTGYQTIFLGAPAFRDSIFNRHDVILLKNDHSTGDITSEAQLLEYQDNYLQIRDVMDQFPDKLFILMSGPSRQPGNITNAEADRARRFYDWLQSPEFMNGHPNICFYDYFDALSNPDDPNDPERNMIRLQYRLPSSGDDHPNLLANMTIGPQLADVMLRILDPAFYFDPSSVPGSPVASARLHEAVPNPFNPATLITWELMQPATVNLLVFDVAGRRVRSLLVGKDQTAGRHDIVWRGADDHGRPQPSGVYFYRLEFNGQWLTGRMTLIR